MDGSQTKEPPAWPPGLKMRQTSAMFANSRIHSHQVYVSVHGLDENRIFIQPRYVFPVQFRCRQPLALQQSQK
jgi:hypothetical protein